MGAIYIYISEFGITGDFWPTFVNKFHMILNLLWIHTSSLLDISYINPVVHVGHAPSLMDYVFFFVKVMVFFFSGANTKRKGVGYTVTLPKFNIAPEKLPFQ